MLSLPDFIVLDFCEWLEKKLSKNKAQSGLSFDELLQNDDARLTAYAQDYLEQQKKKTGCVFKRTMKAFLSSKELKDVLLECGFSNDQNACRECNNIDDVWDCMQCPNVQRAFERFLENQRETYQGYNIQDVTADFLVQSAKNFCNEDNKMISRSDNNQVRYRMLTVPGELSEELAFFNWLAENMDNAASIRKMPSAVFAKYVDAYIKESNKTEADKKRLLKGYRETGWEVLINRLQRYTRRSTYRRKSTSEAIGRYLSRPGKYKCIILPLADDDDQRTYRALITESWEDLNSCSGELLDIYYSEKDTGKSGFDIANRINSLPDRLKGKVPSIILWDLSMEDAEDISIRDLDNKQIVELIRSIVDTIRLGMSFEQIITEAVGKVKELQNEKKNITNYYAPVITGNGNVVGDNNNVGTGIVQGSSNKVMGNQFSPDASVKQITDEFEKAIDEIRKSNELDKEMRDTLLEIFETAKSGVSEKSEEKKEGAKKDFKRVKSFLFKVAPALVKTLADITKIASFFGLGV